MEPVGQPPPQASDFPDGGMDLQGAANISSHQRRSQECMGLAWLTPLFSQMDDWTNTSLTLSTEQELVRRLLCDITALVPAKWMAETSSDLVNRTRINMGDCCAMQQQVYQRKGWPNQPNVSNDMSKIGDCCVRQQQHYQPNGWLRIEIAHRGKYTGDCCVIQQQDNQSNGWLGKQVTNTRSGHQHNNNSSGYCWRIRHQPNEWSDTWTMFCGEQEEPVVRCSSN